MPFPAGFSSFTLVDIATILSAFGAGNVIGYQWKSYWERRKEKKTEVEDWFEDCQDLMSRGTHTIYRAGLRSDIGYKKILTELDEYSSELYSKSKNTPDPISDSTAENVEGLSNLYSKASGVAEVSSQKEGIELIAEIFEMAQREFSEEIDFAEAIDDAGNISGILNEILSMVGKRGVSNEDIAETVENMFQEWDSEEFAYLMMFAADDQSELEETINIVMRMFLELVHQLSLLTYESLEKEKQDYL